MYKNFFLLLALMLFTGCAERGYELTSHAQTHTATAESSIDIDASSKKPKKILEKMKNAVKNELKNQHVTIETTKKL